MQKFFVTIGRQHHLGTVYDTMRLLYPGFEIGYPTEDDPIPQPVEIDENTCNKEVYERGPLVGVWDKSQEEATNHCKRLTEETGLLHDWHYFGGRVVIKRLNK